MNQTTRITHQSFRKPAGGYCFINATALVSAYTAYRQNIIRLFDLRVWLACHELVARRCRLGKGQRPQYTVQELHGLVGGVGGEHLRHSVRRLEGAGFLMWQETALDLTVDTSKLPDVFCRQVETKLDLVKNVKRKVPVPRRVLRILAQGATRALAATVLGHLLRGLYYRNGRCTAGGTCKASWVAEVFDVDLRSIKAARKRLVELGWLVLQPTPQYRLNRWGVSFTVDLGWSAKPKETVHIETPPPRQLSTTGLPPLRKNQKLSTRSRNQEPATRRPKNGVCKETGGEGRPSLHHVQPIDLSKPQRLIELFKQAQREGLVNKSECDRLRFFGAAEHAQAVGTRNPCGLFATVVRQQLWHFITQRDEDTARKRLKGLTNVPAVQSWCSKTSGVAPLAGTETCPVGSPGLSRFSMKTTESRRSMKPAQTRTPRPPVPASIVLEATGLTSRNPSRDLRRDRNEGG